jgi:hypothetical protein
MTHLGSPFVANGITLMECTACGWVHQHPVPDAAVLRRYYESEFWQTEKPGARERFKEQQDWWHATWDDWLWPIGVVGAGRRLLDVGAGHGFFMAHARSMGWEALGVEASPYAPDDCYRGQIEDGEYWQKVDLVTAFWVLEHLRDPATFLTTAREWTDVLLLAVPNEWTELQDKANEVAKKKNWWVHKSHINYFSRVSLDGLLRRTGWTPARWMGTAMMEDCILQGYDYSDDEAIGREMHKYVETAELEMGREERLRIGLSRGAKGEGRDLVVLCFKA